jgi:2-polyprenyl-6-methoxyphenol hydroxylase-like FAD-dependent oxidoreductase
MVYTVTRTIIAGGGIVGLTAGRALLRAGMEVIVAEKADAIRAAGATLGLWGNALSVFDDLDVDVRSVGREAEMYFHGTSGQQLKTPEFGAEDHRYLLAHRANLNSLLAESVGYDNIRLEAAVAGFEEDQDSVTVRFSDGSTEDADLLIGADGLYSKVRAQLFPGTEAQEQAGHRAWRAIVRAEHIDVTRRPAHRWRQAPDPRWLRPRPRRHRVLAAVAVRRAGTGRIGEGGVSYAVCLAHRWHVGLQAHRAH